MNLQVIILGVSGGYQSDRVGCFPLTCHLGGGGDFDMEPLEPTGLEASPFGKERDLFRRQNRNHHFGG